MKRLQRFVQLKKGIVDEYLGHKKNTFEGFSQAKTWNLMKKLSPKNTIDPTAPKKDEHGNLVTDREALETIESILKSISRDSNPIQLL